MLEQLKNYSKSILQCVNLVEVNRLVDNDDTSVILKQFNSEVLIIKYIEKDGYRKISNIFFDLSNSKYEIFNLAEERITNEFVKLEKTDNGNVLVTFSNLEAEVSIRYNYPQASSYMIAIDGRASGSGSGWGKYNLGLK